MSYDISIRSKHAEFKEYIISQGFPEEDRKIVVRNQKPFLEFGLVNGIVTFPYLRNNYTINFIYEFLLKAINLIHGFEFEDLQSGKSFNSTNAQNITQGYIWSQGMQYAKMNQAFIRNSQSAGGQQVDMGLKIPVKFDVLAVLSDDLYKHAQVNKEVNKTLDAYFPKPYVFVNQKTHEYYTDYVWEEFINIILPAGIKISHIRYVEPTNDTGQPEIVSYAYEGFMSILPEPETIEIPGIYGKRLLFKGLEDSKDQYNTLIGGLSPAVPPEGSFLDEALFSLYSIV